MKQLKFLFLLLLPFAAMAQNGQVAPKEVNLTPALVPPAVAGGLTAADRDSLAAKATRLELKKTDDSLTALKGMAITISRLSDSMAAVRASAISQNVLDAAINTRQPNISGNVLTINGTGLPLGSSYNFSAVGGPDTFTVATARQFGAIGDGTTNDATQLQLALNSGARRVVLEKFKVYYILSRLRIPSGVTLDLNGATIRPGGSLLTNSDGIIRTQYSNSDNPFTATGLTIDVKKGRQYFVYAGASNLTPGTQINLAGGGRHTTENYTYYYGWYAAVLRTSNDTVFMASAADTSFSGISITSYRTHINTHVTNGTIDMSGTSGAYGVVFDNTINSSITNLIIKGNLAPGSIINQAIQMTGTNGHVSWNWIYGGGDSNTPGASSYGVQVTGVSITVDHNFIQGFKHAIACGGQRWFASNLVYQYNTIIGDWTNAASLDFHANVMSGKMLFNKIVSGRRSINAVNIRCSNVLFQGNELFIYHPGNTTNYRGIDLDELAIDNIKITDNDFTFFTEATAAANAGYLIAISGGSDFPIHDLTIDGNRMNGGGSIDFNGALGRNIKIRENTILGSLYRPVSISLVVGSIDGYEISKNYIEQNYQSTGSHFSIRIGSGAKWGKIVDNDFKVTFSTNTRDQIRMDGTGNTVLNNTFYAEGGTIDHQATDKSNWVLNNKRINAAGVITSINGYSATPPPASAFFEERTIRIGGTYLVCLKNQTTNVFSWVTIAAAP